MLIECSIFVKKSDIKRVFEEWLAEPWEIACCKHVSFLYSVHKILDF